MTGSRAITLGAVLLVCACGNHGGEAPCRLAVDSTAVAPVTPTADTTPATASRASAPRPGAIGCRRTDAPRPAPDSAVTQDLRGGARFTCVLREGQPPVEAQVDTDDEVGWVQGFRVNASAWTPAWSQALPAQAEGGLYKGAPVLQAIDYDRDGWAELRTQEWAGATGNVKYHVYRFDPARQRFARDSVLSEAITPDTLPGRPCVRSSYDGGGAVYSSWTICREGGRWVDVESVSQQNTPGQPFYVRQRSERRSGRMVVVRTDTLTEEQAWNP